MFKINDFYNKTESGDIVNCIDCINMIKSYSNIIIWGAGNLGSAIGKKFDDMGVCYDYYWDARYADITECNGKKVFEPFSFVEGRENVLIVFCITNAFVQPKLLEMLGKESIPYLDGTSLYQAIACPISIENFDVRECYARKECNVATCKRMSNIMYKLNEKNNKVFINTLDVYLTQKCSLSCKYCYIYNNIYPQNKKHNFDTQRILEDIDIICDVASYIKRMVPFGGEPFLHPDLDIIIEKMASKSNVGVIDIISNGVFNYPIERLKKIKYSNVKINISNYNMALEPKMIEIREKNIKLMQDLDLNVIAHNDTPQWRKPGTLKDNQLGLMQLKANKALCANFCNIGKDEIDTAETLIIKDGRFYPCQHCDTVYNLDIDDFPDDNILLSKETDKEKLVVDIKNLINKEYYNACKYCNPSIELVETAGEQE